MSYFTFISSHSFKWSMVPKVPVHLVFLYFGLLHGIALSTVSCNTSIIFCPVPPETSTRRRLKEKHLSEKPCIHWVRGFLKRGEWFLELNSPEFLWKPPLLRTGWCLCRDTSWGSVNTLFYTQELEDNAVISCPSSLTWRADYSLPLGSTFFCI